MVAIIVINLFLIGDKMIDFKMLPKAEVVSSERAFCNGTVRGLIMDEAKAEFVQVDTTIKENKEIMTFSMKSAVCVLKALIESNMSIFQYYHTEKLKFARVGEDNFAIVLVM